MATERAPFNMQIYFVAILLVMCSTQTDFIGFTMTPDRYCYEQNSYILWDVTLDECHQSCLAFADCKSFEYFLHDPTHDGRSLCQPSNTCTLSQTEQETARGPLYFYEFTSISSTNHETTAYPKNETTDDLNHETTADPNVEADDDPNCGSTNEPDIEPTDGNLSTQSINLVIYSVVFVICFSCFFIVCYLMWRKMKRIKEDKNETNYLIQRKRRNRNDCADDEDPQKVNNIEAVKQIDSNNNNDAGAKASKTNEDNVFKEVPKSDMNVDCEGIPPPSAPPQCSISAVFDENHEHIPFLETEAFGERTIEMQPATDTSSDINVDVLPPGYDPAAENNQNYMMNEETHQVREWLISLDISEYFDIFVENGFDKMERIKLMTSSDLTEMGITKIGHRKQILSAVKIY